MRNGESLILSTEVGPVEFENGKGPYCSGANCFYSVLRYVPGAGFLLLAGYANSDVWGEMWVGEADGRLTYLEDNPVFSPDGRHFAIVSTCDGMGKCVVQIWKAEGPELLFERTPPDGGVEDYEHISWEGNERIAFDIGVYAPEKPGEFHYSRADITETMPDQWQLEWPPHR